jgi:hypothetical protein
VAYPLEDRPKAGPHLWEEEEAALEPFLAVLQAVAPEAAAGRPRGRRLGLRVAVAAAAEDRALGLGGRSPAATRAVPGRAPDPGFPADRTGHRQAGHLRAGLRPAGRR